MEKVLLIGAHPDDESTAGGTALLLQEQYEFHVGIVTAGERGIPGMSLEEAGAVRRKETENAVQLLGAKLHFLGEIDGEVFAGRERCEAVASLIRELSPRAIIMHWPVDIHPDHVLSSALIWRAVQLSGMDCEILFAEETWQSRCFCPTHFVDITSVWEQVVASLRCHISQNENDILVEDKRWGAQYWGAKYLGKYVEVFCQFNPGGGRRPSILDPWII